MYGVLDGLEADDGVEPDWEGGTEGDTSEKAGTKPTGAKKKKKKERRGKKGVWKEAKKEGSREKVVEEDEWMPRQRASTPRGWRRTGRRKLKHANRRRREKRRRCRRRRAARHIGLRRVSIRGGASTEAGQVIVFSVIETIPNEKKERC